MSSVTAKRGWRCSSCIIQTDRTRYSSIHPPTHSAAVFQRRSRGLCCRSVFGWISKLNWWLYLRITARRRYGQHSKWQGSSNLGTPFAFQNLVCTHLRWNRQSLRQSTSYGHSCMEWARTEIADSLLGRFRCPISRSRLLGCPNQSNTDSCQDPFDKLRGETTLIELEVENNPSQSLCTCGTVLSYHNNCHCFSHEVLLFPSAGLYCPSALCLGNLRRRKQTWIECQRGWQYHLESALHTQETRRCSDWSDSAVCPTYGRHKAVIQSTQRSSSSRLPPMGMSCGLSS